MPTCALQIAPFISLSFLDADISEEMLNLTHRQKDQSQLALARVAELEQTN